MHNIASELEIGFMHTLKNSSDTTFHGSDSIVTLLDNFELDGLHGQHVVMVMEALGADLLRILRNSNQKVFTYHRIKTFSKNILEGLHFLHNKCGIMHLDLKPDNLFVTMDPDNMNLSDPKCSARFKIGDFGTSARTSSIVKRTVQTSHYRAPEAFMRVQITSAVGIWSVGCIMYKMATRKMLFPRTKGEICDDKWYLRRISELLGPVKMKYFVRNEANEEIFQKVFGNEKVLVGKPLLVNPISSDELMKGHPMTKSEAEELNGFLKALLSINPKRRLSAEDVLTHPFFTVVCSE